MWAPANRAQNLSHVRCRSHTSGVRAGQKDGRAAGGNRWPLCRAPPRRRQVKEKEEGCGGPRPPASAVRARQARGPTAARRSHVCARRRQQPVMRPAASPRLIRQRAQRTSVCSDWRVRGRRHPSMLPCTATGARSRHWKVMRRMGARVVCSQRACARAPGRGSGGPRVRGGAAARRAAHGGDTERAELLCICWRKVSDCM